MIGGGGEKKTLRLVAQYADACNIGAGPAAGHKLEVLRQHCDAVGRDYDQIEKTTMVRIDPASTKDDLVAAAAEMKDLGFTAAYVYASGITEPEAIIDLMAAALPELR
jgi:alkanesulfonate monooxygenase